MFSTGSWSSEYCPSPQGIRCTIETMNTALLDEARRLGVDERIELVAAIWDTVAEDANTSAFPGSDSHRLELNRRLDDRQKNPGAESPWCEVADRLRQR